MLNIDKVIKKVSYYMIIYLILFYFKNNLQFKKGKEELK